MRDANLVSAIRAGDNVAFGHAYATLAAPIVDRINAGFDALNAFEAKSAAEAAQANATASHTSRTLMLCRCGHATMSA